MEHTRRNGTHDVREHIFEAIEHTLDVMEDNST
jgi:hypothetical protein